MSKASTSGRRRRVAWLLAALLVADEGRAGRLVFDSAADWRDWKAPFGLVQISAQGQLGLVKFRRNINAVEDAPLFSYPSIGRGVVSGGIWEVGSNAAAAGRAIDGDERTFWKPAAEDEVEDWFIDIDLGRAVLATEIRLKFPDQEGARPFRQFSAYVNTGTRISVQEDLLLYAPVFCTTRPNRETTLVIPLSYPVGDTTLVIDGEAPADERFRLVHHVLIAANAKSQDAALAEVEVIAVGDNVGLGTRQRGAFANGGNATDPQNLFDGDMNTLNTITTGVVEINDVWQLGTWFRVDLGALFFIDDMFIYAFGEDEGVLGPNRIDGSGTGHTLLFSDGEESLGTTLPGPDRLKYAELFTHENPRADNLFYLRYRFRPRQIRYLYWHGLSNRGFALLKWGEWMLFSPGHPAEVTLSSDFIDLGAEAGDGRTKVFRSLSWNAEVPPGTQVRLRSRSGNSLGEEYTFYDRAGNLTTQDQWTSKPKILRGRVDTTIVAGQDWGQWSNFYQVSGESFQSESPRRYVQLEMVLSTEDPEVAPAVNSLAIEFEDALLQGARGRLEPRQAQPDADTRFSYAIWPQADSQDRGFDLLRFIVPGAVELDGVRVWIGPQAAVLDSVRQEGDSLLVALAGRVIADSVRVDFTTRVFENATVFAAELGSRAQPGIWQAVDPAERRGNVVMLPTLAASRALIGDLQIDPGVCTPNGDGINDQVAIRFTVFKVGAERARVQLYDLAGNPVAELEPASGGARQALIWSGRDDSGRLVPPGLYLCRIDLAAQAGDDTALRLIGVAY